MKSVYMSEKFTFLLNVKMAAVSLSGSFDCFFVRQNLYTGIIPLNVIIASMSTSRIPSVLVNVLIFT